MENIYVEIVLASSQQKSGLARGVFNASAIKNCIVSVNADGATGNTGLLISDASRAGTRRIDGSWALICNSGSRL